MSKTQSANAENNIRKYVLVDKPFFSKGTEGAKFLFNRGGDTSIPSAIKKFFLTIPMRAEGKRQIAEILKKDVFKEMREAQNLLKEINKLHFWQGVKTSAVSDILAKASLRGIDIVPNQDSVQSTLTGSHTLHESLKKVLPDLEDAYLSDSINVHLETIKQTQCSNLRLDADDLKGLNMLMAYMKDPKKESIDKEEEKLIVAFAYKIKSYTTTYNTFPKHLAKKIAEVHASYVEKSKAATASEDKQGIMSRQQVIGLYITKGYTSINNDNLKTLLDISQEENEFVKFAATIDIFSGDPKELYKKLSEDLRMYLAMTSMDIPL